MNKMTSYQRRKKEISSLKKGIRNITKESQFFQKAIWEARKSIGERLGVEPFDDFCGNEERPIIDDKEGLLNIIKSLPLIWRA